MKYILKKDLPLAKAGTEVTIEEGCSGLYAINIEHHSSICIVNSNIINEWLEEVKEAKTIYDLKEGDKYYYLRQDGKIRQSEIKSYIEYDTFNSFPTEREAKRHKLLRELATRTDKWLPAKGDDFYFWNGKFIDWVGNPHDIFEYNSGLVFRNEEEYNKYMTEEAKDLLFNI